MKKKPMAIYKCICGKRYESDFLYRNGYCLECGGKLLRKDLVIEVLNKFQGEIVSVDFRDGDGEVGVGISYLSCHLKVEFDGMVTFYPNYNMPVHIDHIGIVEKEIDGKTYYELRIVSPEKQQVKFILGLSYDEVYEMYSPHALHKDKIAFYKGYKIIEKDGKYYVSVGYQADEELVIFENKDYKKVEEFIKEEVSEVIITAKLMIDQNRLMSDDLTLEQLGLSLFLFEEVNDSCFYVDDTKTEIISIKA